MRNLKNDLPAFEFGIVKVGFWKGFWVRTLKSSFERWEMRDTEFPEVPISPAKGGQGYYTAIKNVEWDNPDINDRFGGSLEKEPEPQMEAGGCGCGFPGAGCGGANCSCGVGEDCRTCQ